MLVGHAWGAFGRTRPEADHLHKVTDFRFLTCGYIAKTGDADLLLVEAQYERGPVRGRRSRGGVVLSSRDSGRVGDTVDREGLRMDEIHRWLEGQGLGKYARAFADNEIELSVLPHLSEEDLKELGLPLGARRKLQAAVKSMPHLSAPAAATDSRAQSRLDVAERRQLTIMFCDLVGSTALSEKLDPEDLRDVNRAFQDLTTSEIERLDGYVARYMGDGVLAYFGYPRAYEDAAERAVRAGLSLVRKVPELRVGDTGDRLGVRVGIATGPVVVGDLVGEAAAQETAVVGRTPNLAARLQSVAAVNSVVVSPDTYMLAGQFEYEDLGEHNLKGISEPVRLRRVIGTRATRSRFEATHRTKLGRFVGRSAEITLLHERWSNACDGEGQAVLLCGEAGVGKSRITEAFAGAIEGEPHTRLRFQCSPLHLNSALYPVIKELELEAGWNPADGEATKLAKLKALLERTGQTDAETLSLLAELLSLDVPERPSNVSLSSGVRKQKTLVALVDYMCALTTRTPVLVVFEDVHWTDPTTAELLSLLVDAVSEQRVLVLITARPEFESRWKPHANATTLTLNRLTRSQVEAMVLALCDDRPLPAELLERIVEKTDGIPLFVEELTKSLLESGLVAGVDDTLVLAKPLGSLAIPSSLQDSLMARLDRLATVRELTQIGAAIGREFSYRMIRAVSEWDDADLEAGLVQLVDAELIFQRGDMQSASFVFKHALVQDTAYASLLKARRQRLHSRIADVIVEQFPEQAKSRPEVIARHYAMAGIPESAAVRWQEAAGVALGKSAYLEAVASLDEALGQLKQLPETPSRDRLELQLQAKKLGALFPITGHAPKENDETASRVLELYRRVGGDPEAQFGALFVKWGGSNLRNAQHEAYALSREYLDHAISSGSGASTLVGHRIHGTSLLMRGEVDAARANLREALSLYSADSHIPLIDYFGTDLKVGACSFLALVEALAGAIDEAWAVAEAGITHSRQVNHVSTLAYGLFHLRVWLPAVVRDAETLAQGMAEILDLSREHELFFWEPLARAFPLKNARYEELRAAEAAVDRCRAEFKMDLLVPENLCHIGAAYEALGAVADARRVVLEARRLMAQSGQGYWEPEAMRLEGRLVLAANGADSDEALDALSRALSLARRRGLRLLELRSAVDLARLHEERGERSRARNVLLPVYEGFTEGFVSADLTDAKSLLESLE